MNYFISLRSFGVFFLLVCLTPKGFAAPTNDRLANATPIDTLPFTQQQNTAGASNETSEVLPMCLNDRRASVWYQYTATSDQTMLFNTFGSDYDTVLSVWTGDSHPLTALACNDDSNNLKQSQVQVELQTGTTYYINISGYQGETGALILTALEVNPLENDNLADALPVTLDSNASYTYTQMTQEATNQDNESISICNTKSRGSVWFKYTASTDQTIVIDTMGSDYNTSLSVWAGTSHPLEDEVICNDDNSGPQSLLRVALTASETYFINISSVKTSGAGSLLEDSGLLVLNISIPPRNDYLDTAISITEALPYTNTQTTGGATIEIDESSPSCDPVASASVWYLFNPSMDYDNVSFSTFGSSYDTVLSIWEGTGYPLTELACNDNATVVNVEQSNASQVTIPLKADTNYFVDVSGVNNSSGQLNLLVEQGTVDFSIGSQPKDTSIYKCQTAELLIGLRNADGEQIEITDNPIGNQWETNIALPFTYQWYQDEFSNVTIPVDEIENNPVFITPPLEETTDFGVRIINPTGSLESEMVTVTVEENIDNNGAGVGASGDFVSTDAHFMGAVTTLEDNKSVVSFNQSETVAINFMVKIDAAHIEEIADILMVGVYTPMNGTTSFYMREGDMWTFWAGDVVSLAAAEEEIELSECQTVSIFEGRLAGLPGNFKVHTGYRLSDGEIIFNGEPVDFTVEP
ncbi:hypothetical protein [Candidatus Parabeggiatoa sp. HSG14]|uniref:hypothetical protein n=1 Tax=Candidatus Parabeggiatoa sp. HSG14 TaxID=3055593 RepID=UPI0025A878D1|nr:hypothetical protein [Thiotrichales bacterium HSG14]